MTGTVSLDRARAAKAKAAEVFARLDCIVGIGIARLAEGYAVKINLRQAPGEGVSLPEAIDGVPVRVEIVGSIHKR